MTTLIEMARSQVGTAEMPLGSNAVKYNTWYYGHKVSGAKYPWCAVFVSWVFYKCGRYKELTELQNKAYTVSYVKWAKALKIWKPKSSKPKRGWLVVFDFNGDGTSDHIGFVDEYVSEKTIKTIEGNRDNKVKEGYRSTNSVLGYIKIDNGDVKLKDNKTIALEVVKGKWGNGNARKANLEKAGYNYKEIQTLVNTYLKKGKF